MDNCTYPRRGDLHMQTITVIRPAMISQRGECYTLTDEGKEQAEHFARVSMECRTPFDLVIADERSCCTGRHIVETMTPTQDPPPYKVICGGGLMLAAALGEYRCEATRHCLVIVNEADTLAEVVRSLFDNNLPEESNQRLDALLTLEHLEGYRFHLNTDGSVYMMKHVRWDTLIQIEQMNSSPRQVAAA